MENFFKTATLPKLRPKIASLLYQMFILEDRSREELETIAKHCDRSLSTMYKYFEEALPFPADLAHPLFEITKDKRIIRFFSDPWDFLLVRQLPGRSPKAIEHTLLHIFIRLSKTCEDIEANKSLKKIEHQLTETRAELASLYEAIKLKNG